MDTADRLHHLLTHWVEHNEAHSQTYREWAQKAEQEGLVGVGGHLEDAIRSVETANACLRDAQTALAAKTEAHGDRT